MKEASSEETAYGRYVTSDGWFVLNLEDALALRNEENGGAMYPLEPQETPFRDFGARAVRVVWPGEPNTLYHSEEAQEGFLVLSGEGTLKKAACTDCEPGHGAGPVTRLASHRGFLPPRNARCPQSSNRRAPPQDP